MKTLKSELIDKGLHKAFRRKIEQKNARTGNKREEQLTDREWAEIMGANRDTFKRHRGAVRRR